MRKTRLAGVALGFVSAFLCEGTLAADYYCAPGASGDYTQGNPGGDPNYCSRNLALAWGDVIHLAAGTYVLGSTPNANQQIFLQSGVSMVGATDDPSDTVIDGGGAYRAACCKPSAKIRNLTMRNCKTLATTGTCDDGNGFGGAVCAQSLDARDYVISNCVVEGCTATYSGGAGYLGIWRDCIIRNCQVTGTGRGTKKPDTGVRFRGSGGAVWGGDLYDCVVTNNSAGVSGGGIAGGTECAEYVCKAVRCLIGFNRAPAGGGAVVDEGDLSCAAACRLEDCTLVGNETTGFGGGMDACVAVGCRIIGNTTTSWDDVPPIGGGGGAAHSVLTNCTVVGNSARYSGGGLMYCSAEGSLIATNTLFSTQASGSETTGGAGAFDSTLEKCIVENNTSEVVSFGGAMNRCAATDCVIRNNSAPYGGGGYDGTYRQCVITNNIATTRSGGGVYRTTTYNCVIAYNMATNTDSVLAQSNNYIGRGAVCRGYHQGDLIYSNLYAFGAAVCTYKYANPVDITIVNCTIADNRAIADANHNGFNSGYATNCIICGHSNTDVYNCKALVNCFWQEDYATHGLDDPTLALAVNCIHGRGLDPRFVKRPTEGQCGFSIRAGSPCVDAGAEHPWMATAKDILGNDRIYKFSKTVDIGACECSYIPGMMLIFR